jgi:hypothetical protein
VELLGLVSNTPIYGNFRNAARSSKIATPDMLKLGLEICAQVLISDNSLYNIDMTTYFGTGHLDWGVQTELVDKAGDAEMWLRLCALGNRPVVRVAGPANNWTMDTQAKDIQITKGVGAYWADGDASGPSYPATAPVMNDRGQLVTGIDNDDASPTKNVFPVCIRKPSDPQQLMYADRFLDANHIGGPSGPRAPYCPAELFATDSSGQPKFVLDVESVNGTTTYVDAQKWAVRGAINAGLAVYVYLTQLESGQVTPLPPYDQCESLPAPSP